VRVTGSNRGNRAKRGKNGVYKSTKAAANGDAGSPADNGHEEPATTGSGRAVVIPRKARPASADDSS
jgi:hypothetical protein